MKARVEAPFDVRCDLGEGPHWDADTQRLSFVDIDAGVVHVLDPESGASIASIVEAPVSFAIPVADATTRVCGSRSALTVRALDGPVSGSLPVGPPDAARRLNDGKADPAGRLWFGSMSLRRATGDGAFYRLDESGLTIMDDAVTVSNGLDWDLDRGRMYYVDSPRQRIEAYTYDVRSGELGERRTFAAIDPADGTPDGLTVDAEGGVWVALFRGGAVRRYDPDGAVDEHFALPVTCPTCPAFGGADLATLFVTTSRHLLDEEQRARQPLAGALLVVDPGVRGRAGNSVSAAVAAAVGSR